MNCNNNQNNNGCGCNCNPHPTPTPEPVDINMSVCDRNINMLPMLQTYTTKVLKPNIDGCCKKNILKQCMMNCENYKYVIKWDFDLNGQTITVPENCILEFDGGSLKNGTIIGQDTVFINVGDVDIWGENLTREGTWREHSGGGSIDVDDHLSDTSTNPVQNKVITEALEEIVLPDKPYDPEAHSGLGRKTLQLKDGSNILTQEDFDQDNTIYVIQYDFDLNGQEIQVPAGCVLDFDGGSVNNGILHVNSATINGNPRGNAIYGVGYKDGNPLMNTYKPKDCASVAEEFAFMLYYSSLLYVSISPQSMNVTEDYIIIGGNDENSGPKTGNDNCIFTLFDREYNFKGQAYIDGVKHGGTSTIKDNILYIGGRTAVYVYLDELISACGASVDSGGTVIPDVTAYPLELESPISIAYDKTSKEFAYIYSANGDYYLKIYDENFNLKRSFDTPLRQYVEDNFVCPSMNLPHAPIPEGYYADADYRNGVIIASYMYGYGYSILVPCRSIYVIIDANTGIPVSVDGYVGSSFSTECEGISFDPTDDDVLWVSYHEFYYASPNNRVPSEKISRVSFTKTLNSIVVPSQLATPSVMTNGSPMTVWVDNSFTGLSSGGLGSPFKTLETAMLMSKCWGNCVRFLIKATDIPYSLGYIGVSRYLVFEGQKVGDKKPIIKNGWYMVDGGNLSMSDIILVSNPKFGSGSFGAPAITAYNNGLVELTNVDMYAEKYDDSIPRDKDSAGIILYGAELKLAGTLKGVRFGVLIDFRGGASLIAAGHISLIKTGRAYIFREVGRIADGAVSAVEYDETCMSIYTQGSNSTTLPNIVEKIPENIANNAVAVENYVRTVMAKCINDPGVVTFKTPYNEDYPYNNHNNQLIGTAYLNIVDNSAVDTENNHIWRKVGTSPVPSVDDVSIMLYPKVKKGILFTSEGQQIAKAPHSYIFSNGWFTVSFLAKGHGNIRPYIHYIKADDTEVYLGDTIIVNSDDWKPYSHTYFITDGKEENGWILVKFSCISLDSENDSITIAAVKAEEATDASGWTPNENEYPTGGPTTERPVGINIGYQYFDIDLNKTIVWNGSLATPAWVNIDGTPLT